jgi:diacylglycerol O-acyltransferase
MTLVDGLEGGGWMLATKTHHAMIDGVGSIDIGHMLLDAEPDPGPRPPPSQPLQLKVTAAPGTSQAGCRP